MDKKNLNGRREIMTHDADGLKYFWEKKIEKQTTDYKCEHERKNKSALSKLREEWTQRLESRIRLLQSFHEDQKKQLCGGSKEAQQHNANTAA
ncbi:hypothetical protein XELAEV_18006972mg [Xenopus laevis]|uniref:Uncharacterized protein n=1 Tax=Xenopus laevis TaxID=8355 RepID=A0A974E109_XENLA|nr:hypothetical protein XELAEV_18006972mg [Xenopus laevis]